IMGLLAAEMTAVTGRDPGDTYRTLTSEFGEYAYERIDAPADASQKKALAGLSAEAVRAGELAGDVITARMTHAAGNNAAIGDRNAWSLHGCAFRRLNAEAHVSVARASREYESGRLVAGAAVLGRRTMRSARAPGQQLQDGPRDAVGQHRDTRVERASHGGRA